MLVIGGMLALAGCGGDDAPEPARGAQSEPGQPALVVTLGDSITSGSPGYDPDPAARAALGFGDDERSQYQHWASQVDSGLGFRNCGVFGATTDEIATRLDECVDGAAQLIIQGGINDIGRALGAGDPDAALAAARSAASNIDEMVVEAQERGLRVAVADVLPWNNGFPLAAAAIEQLNRDIAAIADSRGVPLLRFHATLEDPQSPGRMRADLTADGDHPSVAGYRALGELVARALG